MTNGMTKLSNLQLSGQALEDASVSASLSDSTAEFTNRVELDIGVPDNEAWALTGNLRLQITRATGNDGFVPKQWRVGMMAYGQYVERPIPATVDVDPDTLNLKSKGNWVTAYIALPEGYSVNDIDLSSVKLHGVVASWGEVQGTVLMVKFDRQSVAKTLSPGSVTLTVTGTLNGRPFTGTDAITVISK